MIIETTWSIGDIVWAIMDRQEYDKPIRKHGELAGYERIVKPCIARVVGVSVSVYEDHFEKLRQSYTLSFGPDEYSSNAYHESNIYKTEEECREAFELEYPAETSGSFEI